MNGGHIDKYFVLTVKDYLPRDQQIKVEKEIAEYIKTVWMEYQIGCVFIPTGSNPIEENDIPVGIRLARLVGDQDIFCIKIPSNPEITKSIIRKATFTVCTRMHSAIFSITEFVPCIAIAYEHKSIGLFKSLQLQHWYIHMREITNIKLSKMTSNLLKSDIFNSYIYHLKKQREHILSQKQQLLLDIVK